MQLRRFRHQTQAGKKFLCDTVKYTILIKFSAFTLHLKFKWKKKEERKKYKKWNCIDSEKK